MTWWAPIFNESNAPSRSMAIPWRREGPPTEKEYREALLDRIDELIQANRKEARRGLDMEFEEICAMKESQHWAFHIGLSPQMNKMLARIDWAARSEGFEFDDVEDVTTLFDYVNGLGVR
jgi:hypothetical protein